MDVKHIIKAITPPFIITVLKGVLRKEEQKDTLNFKCSVCQHRVDSFRRLPQFYDDKLDEFGYVHSIFQFETLNRQKYSCPNCGASDRNRLYALYLRQEFFKREKDNIESKLLDVAPDQSLKSLVLIRDSVKYRSVDMYMDGVDDKADITDLSIYEDNRFDIILCSHVLEHIVEDRKAIAELYRVLAKGGFGIIMVPILLTLEEDLENKEYSSEALRWKYFGQGDHVRMFSKAGFILKLEEAGFKIHQLGVDYFGEAVFKEYGIHPRSILYVVEK